jgi:hypothetical protein
MHSIFSFMYVIWVDSNKIKNNKIKNNKIKNNKIK